MTSKHPSKSAIRKSPAQEPLKSAKKKPSAALKVPKVATTLSTAKTPKAPIPAAPRSKSEGHGAPVSPSELSSEVMEFITAIDEYKRSNRRPFPNWSEVFEIVKALGYQRSA